MRHFSPWNWNWKSYYLCCVAGNSIWHDKILGKYYLAARMGSVKPKLTRSFSIPLVDGLGCDLALTGVSVTPLGPLVTNHKLESSRSLPASGSVTSTEERGEMTGGVLHYRFPHFSAGHIMLSPGQRLPWLSVSRHWCRWESGHWVPRPLPAPLSVPGPRLLVSLHSEVAQRVHSAAPQSPAHQESPAITRGLLRLHRSDSVS